MMVQGGETMDSEDTNSEVASPLKAPDMLDESAIQRQMNIVVSGVSCRLPRCRNMAEFRKMLLENRNINIDKDCELDISLLSVNHEKFSLPDLDKFDAGYFGISPEKARVMDPQLRQLLEVVTEAVVDAGEDPYSLQNAGVYIGVGDCHAQYTWSTNPDVLDRNVPEVCSKHALANTISKVFNLSGPSYTLQGSDAAGSLALDRAYDSMLRGEIDCAIVGGVSIDSRAPLTDKISLEFLCRPFDANASGMCYKDGVVTVFLRRQQGACRVYASVVHSKAQMLAADDAWLSYPNEVSQARFLSDFYEEAGVDVEDIDYVEAHGCGLLSADRSEVAALATALCGDKSVPLQIGSVKANVGHTMAASGLVSLLKVLVAMETGMIPPTENFQRINPSIPALVNGRVQVVSGSTRLHDGYCAVNCLGQGGYQCHMVLYGNEKTRALHYMASSATRLCLHQASTEQGLQSALKYMCEHSGDVELHSLQDSSQQAKNQFSRRFPYRGYCLLNATSSSIKTQAARINAPPCPVWYVFPGMGCQWARMGRDMMQFGPFRMSIHESGETLQPLGFHLHRLIMEGGDNTYDTPLNSFVAITAIQLGLVKLLNLMNVKPSGLIGHSSGEILCAYVAGCLTAREAILTAYWCGRCIEQADLPKGRMAAIGMTWEDARATCPEQVLPACHNAMETVTVSGPAAMVERFVSGLRERGVFTREVRCAGVAFHSPCMKSVVPLLRKHLEQIIPVRERPKYWISTSLPESDWDTPGGQTFSVEYITINLTHPVLFQEALKKIPSNAVVIEVGPHDLLQAILKRSLDCSLHVGLMRRHHRNNVDFFLENLGQCYLSGLDLNPLGIFPSVDYPVSRGTPMLSPLVTWDHTQSWDMPSRLNELVRGHGQIPCTTFEMFSGRDGRDGYLRDHVIGERTLFPFSGHLVLAWKCLARFYGELFEDLSVMFEEVHLHRQTLLSNKDSLQFRVTLIPLIGEFEVIEGHDIVCSGKIRHLQHPTPDTRKEVGPMSPLKKMELQLTSEEVYYELSSLGHNYGSAFRMILQAENTGESGVVRWTGDWLLYLEGMLQMNILCGPVCPTSLTQDGLPSTNHSTVGVAQLSIIPSVHKDQTDSGSCMVYVDKGCATVTSGGITMQGVVTMATGSEKYQSTKGSSVPTITTTAASLKIRGRPPTARWEMSLNGASINSHLVENPDYILCYPRYVSIGSHHVSCLRQLGQYSVEPTLEFSGIDKNGTPVMGLVQEQGICSEVYARRCQVWPIPEGWSLQRACVIPTAFRLAYYALVVRAHVHKNKSVLIIGSDMYSQAALDVAIDCGSQCFAAAESAERIKWLENRFDTARLKIVLKDNIHSEVLRQTNGTGVDIVFTCCDMREVPGLGSLLKNGGVFLQCGALERGLEVTVGVASLLQRNCQLCHVSLHRLDPEDEVEVSRCVADGISSGVVTQPQEPRIYPSEQAVRAIGHKEKHPQENVVLKLGGEVTAGPLEVQAEKRVLLSPHKVYILVRGRTPQGLALASWLINRGARKLIFTECEYIESGLEQRKFRHWKQQGVTVALSERDVCQIHDARELINDTKKLGPLGGIFYLILMSEDQQDPPVVGAVNLDHSTHGIKSLDWFVLVQIGGEVDQQLISLMEKRKAEALQGRILHMVPCSEGQQITSGEQQITSGNQQMTSGEPWRLDSDELEEALMCDTSIVDVSHGISGPRREKDCESGPSDVITMVGRLLGLEDLSRVDGSLSLLELGVDKYVALEMKHLLEKHAALVFKTDEIRRMTVQELCNLRDSWRPVPNQDQQQSQPEAPKGISVPTVVSSSAIPLTTMQHGPVLDSTQLITQLNCSTSLDTIPVYIAYSDECADEISHLAMQLKSPVYGIHPTRDCPLMSLQAHTGYILQNICLNNNYEPFILIGHKFGCPVAIEMTLQLQAADLPLVKHLVCIEGSHAHVSVSEEDMIVTGDKKTVGEMETEAIRSFLAVMGVDEIYNNITIDSLDDLNDEALLEKIHVAIRTSELKSVHRVASLDLKEDQLQDMLYAYVQQYQNMCLYQPDSVSKIGVTLIRGRQPTGAKILRDYSLSKVYEDGVSVHILNTECGGLLAGEMCSEVASTINAIIDKVKVTV